MEIITREATSCDLKELVAKFIPESIGKDIEKSCQGIYPLQVGQGAGAGRRGAGWAVPGRCGGGQWFRLGAGWRREEGSTRWRLTGDEGRWAAAGAGEGGVQGVRGGRRRTAARAGGAAGIEQLQ